MSEGRIGFIDTPAQGNKREPGLRWCADNGCFGSGYPGDVEYLAWLTAHRHEATNCVFATAPDVVGDAKATLARSKPFLPVIRALGYPAALVAQDGLEELKVPWSSFDVLFIGGTTEWKLGEAARELAAEAKARGKWVHCGRVNSARRMRYCAATYPFGLGADSVDGTYLAFGPDQNLPKLLSWIDELETQQALPLTGGAA